jgi:hypothetical protein
MVISKACAALLMAFSKTLLIADVDTMQALLTGRPWHSYARIAGPTLRQIKFKAEKKKGRGSRGLFAM